MSQAKGIRVLAMISHLATSQSLVKDFASRGFVIFSDSVLGLETLASLRSELERVLLGKSGGLYDSQVLPTKVLNRTTPFSFIYRTHVLTCDGLTRCRPLAAYKSRLCFKLLLLGNLQRLFR